MLLKIKTSMLIPKLNPVFSSMSSFPFTWHHVAVTIGTVQLELYAAPSRSVVLIFYRGYFEL